MPYWLTIWDVDRLSFIAKSAYCLLARFADRNGKCWPSISTLQKKSGLSRPTIRKAIRILESEGYLTINHTRSSHGDFDANIYILIGPGVGNDVSDLGKEFTDGGKPDCQGVGNKVAEGRKARFPGVGNDVSPNYSIETNPSNNYKRSVLYKAIIDYLNEKCGTHFRVSASHTKHIQARLNEGYTFDDFKTVVDKKAAEWIGSDQAKYLRPQTLFGPKFDGYLNQLGGDSHGGRNQGPRSPKDAKSNFGKFPSQHDWGNEPDGL